MMPYQHGSVQLIYFTYSQNIQINLLLQSKALVTKYDKELLITKNKYRERKKTLNKF